MRSWRDRLAARASRLDADALLPIPVLAMEALWLYPWMVWISSRSLVSWMDPPLGLGSSVLVLAAGFLSARYAGKQGLTAGAAALAANVLLIGLLLRVEQGGASFFSAGWGAVAQDNLQKLIAGGFYGLYLVWRGVSVGGEEVTPARLNRTFGGGFLALALLLVIWSGDSAGAFEPLGGAIGGYVAGFFFAGLSGLALANIRALNKETGRLAGGFQRMGTRWASLAVAVATLLIFAALGLASVASLNFATFFADPARTVAGWLLAGLIYGVLLPLGYIVAVLIFPLRWLVDLVRANPETTRIRPPDLRGLRSLAEGEEGFNVPSELVAAAKWGLLALAVTIAVLLLVRALVRRRKARSEEAVDETTESLWTWARFWADLRSFLGGLLRSLRPRRLTRAGLGAPAAVRARLDLAADMDVRQMYRHLLREGERSGRARRAGETPWEYAMRLQRAVPGAGTEVREITEEYVRARYGRLPVSDERRRLLNRIWRTVRDALRLG